MSLRQRGRPKLEPARSRAATSADEEMGARSGKNRRAFHRNDRVRKQLDIPETCNRRDLWRVCGFIGQLARPRQGVGILQREVCERWIKSGESLRVIAAFWERSQEAHDTSPPSNGSH